jgi:hypothetical protein
MTWLLHYKCTHYNKLTPFQLFITWLKHLIKTLKLQGPWYNPSGNLLRRLCINLGWSVHMTARSYVSIPWGKIHSNRDMHLSCNCVQLAWIAHPRNEVTASLLSMSHIFDAQCSLNFWFGTRRWPRVNKVRHWHECPINQPPLRVILLWHIRSRLRSHQGVCQ